MYVFVLLMWVRSGEGGGDFGVLDFPASRRETSAVIVDPGLLSAFPWVMFMLFTPSNMCFV